MAPASLLFGNYLLAHLYANVAYVERFAIFEVLPRNHELHIISASSAEPAERRLIRGALLRFGHSEKPSRLLELALGLGDVPSGVVIRWHLRSHCSGAI
jgi:hypothetical protein